VYVDAGIGAGIVPGSVPGSVRGTSLELREGPLSTMALLRTRSARVTLEPGWRVEVNLRAVE